MSVPFFLLLPAQQWRNGKIETLTHPNTIPIKLGLTSKFLQKKKKKSKKSRNKNHYK
jgi:hypothetical protein